MEVVIPSAFFLNKVPPVYVSEHQQNSKPLSFNLHIP